VEEYRVDSLLWVLPEFLSPQYVAWRGINYRGAVCAFSYLLGKSKRPPIHMLIAGAQFIDNMHHQVSRLNLALVSSIIWCIGIQNVGLICCWLFILFYFHVLTHFTNIFHCSTYLTWFWLHVIILILIKIYILSFYEYIFNYLFLLIFSR